MRASKEGKIPCAGEIARIINRQFKEVRNYLSEIASHFSFDWDALEHIVDLSVPTFKVSQDYNESELRVQLGVLFNFVMALAIEGSNCLNVSGTQDPDFMAKIESCLNRGKNIFEWLPFKDILYLKA